MYFYDSNHSEAWIKLNPDYEVHVFDVTMCEQFLIDEFGDVYRDIFQFIADEAIKMKFWAICILYAYGGVYSDIDNEPLVPLDQIIDYDIDFVTCNSYLQTFNFNFNPSFIASHKDDPILKKCIDWYINRYTTKLPYSFLEWSGMRALTDVLQLDNFSSSDGIFIADTMKIQIIKECFDTKSHTVYCEYGGKRVINISSFIRGLNTKTQ